MHNIFLCPIHIRERDNSVEISALIELIVRRIIHVWTYLAFRREVSSKWPVNRDNPISASSSRWAQYCSPGKKPLRKLPSIHSCNDRASKINRIFPQLASSGFWPPYSRIVANRIDKRARPSVLSGLTRPSFFPSKARFLVTTIRHVTATTQPRCNQRRS